jgi:DNA repair protein RadB|tara:strand:+ start:26 stop:721 length:696 start_codon:yes stop_codon:yes gene_type:complete
MERCSTGSKLIDNVLEGGLENEVTTTIYGPSGSGKTNIAILTALYNAKNEKIIFIDTEGGFSVDRVKQMFPETHERRLKNLIIFKPTTFEEQTELFNNLEKFAEKHKPKLIVVDSISMLYRLELGERKAYDVNKEMARQLSILRKISHELTIPILLTNQVYADFERKNDIKMVGGDLMKYTSKCIIKLELRETGRVLKLLKHRSIPIKEVNFKITQENIEETTEKRKFSLF